MMRIGIIGFGRFGQLMAKHLKDKAEVFVTSRSNHEKEARQPGVKWVSLKEAASKDVVIPSVPIRAFESTLTEIIPFLKPGALVCDVCSVKEEPVKAMKKLIPSDVECIATHPLFGPDSAKDGITGKKIVVCNVRCRRFAKVKAFLASLGLTVIECTPEEHDRQMAQSLALVHFLGKGLRDAGVTNVPIATPTHSRLLELIDIVNNDSEELFIDMQKHNRFAPRFRKKLVSAMLKIDKQLDSK